MNKQISKYSGAYYVTEGNIKGRFKIQNSANLNDIEEFIHDGRNTIRDQASQYLNSIGLMVVGIIEYSPVMCLMIVNEG
jgi:hypothetical protein